MPSGNLPVRTGVDYRLQDLPICQRPRELLDRFGVDAVAEDVLLAVILRSGTRGVNVLELARQLLREYKSLSELASASETELLRPGIGRVKAQVLKAALELGRRLASEKIGAAPVIRTPADVAAVLREQARVLKGETFWVLMLNAKNRLQGEPVAVSRGVLDSALVHPREVFRAAIHAASAAVVLAHNHPSGDPTPSDADLKITRQLIEAGKILSIRVLDHVVLARGGGMDHQEYVSVRESGMVDFSN